MKNPRIDPSETARGRRGMVWIAAGVLVLAVGATGIHVAFAGGSPLPASRQDPAITSTRPPAPVTIAPRVPPVTPVQATPDPVALADGVYPTWVRAVDVPGGTVTVDVLQTFFGEAAHQAAIQDGLRWADVRYEPVYIRNENPLLRTLPVSRDARIKLIGVCMAPSRSIGLRQLRRATTPSTHTFYYDVTVVGGSVTGIQQKIAIAAC